MGLLIDIASTLLSQYPSNIATDAFLLQTQEWPRRAKMAIQYRLEEKRLIAQLLEHFEAYLDALLIGNGQFDHAAAGLHASILFGPIKK